VDGVTPLYVAWERRAEQSHLIKVAAETQLGIANEEDNDSCIQYALEAANTSDRFAFVKSPMQSARAIVYATISLSTAFSSRTK
jgi:hypothetical protein